MPLCMDSTSYGSPTIAGNMNDVFVGKYCSIADSVLFDGGAQHNRRFITTYPLWKLGAPENRDGMCRGDIVVGNDVWIGDGALIMSGVTIGDGAIVGARAVVTHDVQPYTIVAGVPARVKGYRFNSLITHKLRDIKWWDWPKEKILANAHLLLSEHIDAFIEEHG